MDAVVLGRLGEVFAEGQLRVGIRLEHVGASFRVEPQVDAGVPAQVQGAEDALADVLDVPRQVGGRSAGPVMMPCRSR